MSGAEVAMVADERLGNDVGSRIREWSTASGKTDRVDWAYRALRALKRIVFATSS